MNETCTPVDHTQIMLSRMIRDGILPQRYLERYNQIVDCIEWQLRLNSRERQFMHDMREIVKHYKKVAH